MFIIYVVDLSTKNKMWRRGLKFLQKLKMQMVVKRKKNVFSYFISEIPNFPVWTFLGNAQCFVGALL